MRRWQILILLLTSLVLSGCMTARPDHVDNICKIFRQYPKWYWATQNVQRRWGVPIPVQMAIVHQESRFTADAKPPRTKLLWIIPWKRPSSAYGYTQALNDTWKRYKRQAGGRFASRDDFANAVDFIGWYASRANHRAGIPKNDTYQLYLAYHEGVGGFIQGTYKRKAWLVNVAHKVNRRALTYDAQLAVCRRSLRKKPWYRIW